MILFSTSSSNILIWIFNVNISFFLNIKSSAGPKIIDSFETDFKFLIIIKASSYAKLQSLDEIDISTKLEKGGKFEYFLFY